MLKCRRLGRAGALLASALVLSWPTFALAQSSAARTIAVPFGAPGTADGYLTASANVTYTFIACMGEMHIAYSLNQAPATVGSSYSLSGKVYPVRGAPPQPTSIAFAGTVYRGPAVVGSFSDAFAGEALGMGCFSGQTQKIAKIADVLGANATPAQIVAYFNSLRVQVRPGKVLRSASQESAIRGELRRAEAEAAAAKRKAEQEQLAKAKTPADPPAAAGRSTPQAAPVQSQASAQAPSQGQRQASAPAPAARPGGAPPSVAAAQSPPRLSDAERIARAIASDKVLADRRLEDQRRALAQQQANLAAQQQRQNEAMIAAAPAMMELGAGLYGALDAWDARVKSRAYLAAQQKQAGKCRLPNGMASPKDGDITLGVEFTAKLNKSACGLNPADRYKAFKLEIPERTTVRFTIRPAAWRIFTSYTIDVRDLQNTSRMYMDWREWGAIQKVNDKSVVLPAGVYVVTVSNGVEDIFADFKLRVDAIGANGGVIAAAAPPAVPAVRAAPVTTPPIAGPADPTTPGGAVAALAVARPTPAPAPAVAAKPGRGADLGLRVAPGERAVISEIAPGGPAEAAGLRLGDEIYQISGAGSGFFGAVRKIADQAQLDQWLATQKTDAAQALTILRGGEWKIITVTPTPHGALPYEAHFGALRHTHSVRNVCFAAMSRKSGIGMQSMSAPHPQMTFGTSACSAPRAHQPACPLPGHG